MSALHYKGISHESREKIWLVSSKLCGVAYVIYFTMMMILLCSFAYHFFWSINTFMKTGKQQAWERVSNKQTKKQQVFFLRPSFSWGVRTYKKKLPSARATGWIYFFWCWNVHIIFYTPLTWHGYHQYSHQNTIFCCSFSRNFYGWIFLLLKAFFQRILFSQLLWRNTLWHFT